jgi:hypothetical protein
LPDIRKTVDGRPSQRSGEYLHFDLFACDSVTTDTNLPGDEYLHFDCNVMKISYLWRPVEAKRSPTARMERRPVAGMPEGFRVIIGYVNVLNKEK